MQEFFGLILFFLFVWILSKVFSQESNRKNKGQKAEIKLKNFLIRNLDCSDYFVLHDLTIPSFDQRTSQIDIVVVSVFGFFVIENKNFSGVIFGKKNAPYWIQYFSKERYFKFKNPFHQNFGHIKALQNLLHIPFENFFSVIVFSGSAKFGDYISDDVVSPGESLFLIKEKTKVVFSKEEVAAFVSKLKSESKEPGFETDKKHIETIRNRPECLLCGSSMVLRVAKKGSKKGREFWGCSKFPHCKGLKEKK